MASLQLFGCKGCGSAIAEMFLALADIPYDRKEVNYEIQSTARDELTRLNPLTQVPTLVLQDGLVLTETLAIAHFAQRENLSAPLIPKPDNANYLRFYRWAVFLIAAVYPTWTYGDFPNKWLPGLEDNDAKLLRITTDDHRKVLWQQIEKEIVGPYFLGEEFSIIDVYLGVMTNWRPGLNWFGSNTPKILRIRETVKAHPKLKSVWATNFDS